MMNLRSFWLTLSAALLTPLALHGQMHSNVELSHPFDPCGVPDTNAAAYRIASTLNWGYGFDSLQSDVQRWGQSAFVKTGSIGSSVQNRLLYELVIQDTTVTSAPRTQVWIHARTHPSEVQGTWVTNRMIALLLGESALARLLRSTCVFNIVPMINPDGVELRLARQNANKVDIESNWATNPGEPEVQALRARFASLMGRPNPIRVALNMHSSIDCRRYFVYHAAGGTTDLYASRQQTFINSTRSYYPGGIEPYTYFVSWATSAPTYYPESWFWYNHREAVLALTYEDKNCAAAGGFDSTAYAILHGVADFLGVNTASQAETSPAVPTAMVLHQNYPNPFNPLTTLLFELRDRGSVQLTVCDVLGRPVRELIRASVLSAGEYRIAWDGRSNDGGEVPSGVYFARVRSESQSQTIRMVLVR